MNEVIYLDTNHPAIKYLCHQDANLSKAISLVGSIEYKTYGSDTCRQINLKYLISMDDGECN